MTIKRGERAVIRLLLVQKCRLPPPHTHTKKNFLFGSKCVGDPYWPDQIPSTIVWVSKYNLGTCSSCGPRCHDLRTFLERHHASEEQSTSIFEYQLLFHLYLHCRPICSGVIRFINRTSHLWQVRPEIVVFRIPL